MRFFDYMKLASDDEKISIFRSLEISIIKDSNGYDDIVEELSKKYTYIKESFDIIDNANKKLKRYYTGKYRYGFRIKDGIDEKIKKHKDMFIQYLEINDDFEKIKNQLESESEK